MKLTRITIKNTIGLRHLDVALDTPLTLFAGPNGAGKTSIAQALRLALVAEPSRVSLKKDFDKLITEGAQDAAIHVHADGEEWAVAITGSGKVSDHQAGRETPPALPFCLDMHRFAALADDERRAFLFGLTGIEIGGDAIIARLKERGCHLAMAEEVKPLLRNGFPAAAEYARKRATEGKGAWKATTGGETWGKDKGARWRAEQPAADAAKLEQARADLAKIEAEIEAETARLGELQGRARQAQEQAAKLADLREKAGRYARIQDKLNRDEAELKEWQAKVEATREQAGLKPTQNTAPHPCPHCGGLLLIHQGRVEAWQEETLPHYDAEAAAKLPEYEGAVALMQRAVAHGRRDLEIADKAANALKEMEEAGLLDAPTEAEIAALKARIDSLKHDKKNQEAGIRMLEESVRRAEQADAATRKAGTIHQAILDWLAIADALEPGGIPGELLAEALRPINDRLRHGAELTGWMQPVIGADMTVTADGRPYALLSESEQWRVDALLTEAIAQLAGLRLLVLDRLDVLDLPGRSQALAWLHELATAGELDTAILLATLKALPADLPVAFRCHWLNGGRIDALKAAA